MRFELPYQVIGGTKFYERAEIKDAIAYLSLLVNPSDQVLRGRSAAPTGHRQHQPGAARLSLQHRRPADLCEPSYFISLAPYGYYWFRLEPPAQGFSTYGIEGSPL